MTDRRDTLVFLCNAFDDETRRERGITTDSPAASRKVLQMARAARLAGVRAIVVSYGRGRQDGSKRHFGTKVVRVNGVPVVYLRFVHRRGLSELLSLVSPIPVLRRLNRRKGRGVVVFYNRTPSHLAALLAAPLMSFRTAVDLEDAEVNVGESRAFSVSSRLLRFMFDTFCSAGALVAARPLADATTLRPVETCYGVAEETGSEGPDFSQRPLNALLGGSVSRETGAALLADAILRLRTEPADWAREIRFVITGQGDCLGLFESLAKEPGVPEVVVFGRTDDDSYRRILGDTHIGLALKLNSGRFANTTFPSKVVEFASRGILVLTTDISDVRHVLSDGALYLTADDPGMLVDRLRWVVDNRGAAAKLAKSGRQAVARVCAPMAVGAMIRDFFFSRASNGGGTDRESTGEASRPVADSVHTGA